MSAAENQAVFLSCRSQDTEAARRICEALRATGVEVWFDQNELRGRFCWPAEWDQKIRRQLKECVLPSARMPVISAAAWRNRALALTDLGATLPAR